MLFKLKNWLKNSDTFEVMAIFAIILGAIIMGLTFWLGTLNDINLTGKSADILDLSEYIGGLVGSLWSLAGVLLFYASLSSQKEDLERQKELLVKQIDEVVAQTKEFRIQNEMAKEQKNEETFFQLLRFHNEIISTITIEQQEVDFVSGENISKLVEGRKAFVEYYDIYKRFFQEASESSYKQDEEGLSRIFDKAYNSFYLEYQADLGHYFRNLYNLILFLDSLKASQQSFYIGLLMAQLSNYELTLLFFHCLRTTNKDFKLLVEKYAILDQVPKDEVTTMAQPLYDLKAFGESGFGSGDIIEDDEDNVSELNEISNFESDNILSKFNLPNMDLDDTNQESDHKEKQDSSVSTMDDILSKLKNLSSQKFPESDELDADIDSKILESERPLTKLKDKNESKKEETKSDFNDSEELSFEDFFDDSAESNFEEDAEIIDMDQIAKLESKSLNFDDLDSNNELQSIKTSTKENNINNNENLSEDFSDLWDDDPFADNTDDNEEEIDPELDLLKKSLVNDSEDEFAKLKNSVSNQETEYTDLKSLIDSDIDEDSMLFNKDADIKDENKTKITDEFNLFEEDEDNDVENKFNINFEESEKESESINDNSDIELEKSDNKIDASSNNKNDNNNNNKLNVKVNPKKNNKGGKGFLSKLN